MASKILAFGVPAIALGGALTATTLLVSASNRDGANGQSHSDSTAAPGSLFDFNATFLGQTLSYKKSQVVATVKEVGKEIKQTGANVVEGSK